MKKGIITIFVTLFIFFSSTLGVFAQSVEQDSWSVDAQYWLYDLMLQCTTPRNYLAGDWGYAVNDYGSGTFMYQLNAGYDLELSYNVPAGESVYFRWAVPTYSLPEDGSFYVLSYASNTLISANEYSHSTLFNPSASGLFGSLGSIIVTEDYKNTTDEVQTVKFFIDNIDNDFGIHLIPILCGTDIFFNDVVSGPVNGSDTVNMDLTFIEQTLDNILSNQITNSQFSDSIGNVTAYIGSLTSEVRLNGTTLKSIDTVLSSIKTKIDTIDINVADIKLFISYIRSDVKDIRSYVNFIMADVDEINITTKQIASTLQEMKELLNQLVNGFDSSKKDSLVGSTSDLNDTLTAHDSIEQNAFMFVDALTDMLPIPDLSNNMVSNSFSIIYIISYSYFSGQHKFCSCSTKYTLDL